MPGVVGAAPYVELHGLLAHEPELQPALIRGVDPATESSVSTVSTSLVSGDLGSLRAGARNIVLGQCARLSVVAWGGDSVTVMVPVANPVTGELSPRIQRFTVSGLFEVGCRITTASCALVNLDDALALQGQGSAPTGIQAAIR